MAYKYEWRDSNGQKYLYIEADTRYELGRAYGEGNPGQITPLVDEFEEKKRKEKKHYGRLWSNFKYWYWW